MKLKRTFFTILSAVCMIFMLSCSAEEAADKLTGGCLSFTEDYQAVTAASQAFSENPTTENCEAYKAALIGFYKQFKDCPYWEDGDYQESVNEIKNMDCSDL